MVTFLERKGRKMVVTLRIDLKTFTDKFEFPEKLWLLLRPQIFATL